MAAGLGPSAKQTPVQGREIPTSQGFVHATHTQPAKGNMHIHTHTQTERERCYFTHSFVQVLEEQEQSLFQVPKVTRCEQLKELRKVVIHYIIHTFHRR